MTTGAQPNGRLALEKLSKAFTPHRPIDLPEFLAGRLSLLYRAIDALNTEGLHTILFGDRGTGKTSLARVLAYNLQEPERDSGRRAILVSCTSSDSYRSIWRKAFQEILISQRQLGFVQEATAPLVGRVDLGENKLDDPNDVRLFIRSLPNPSVIVIDEFDRLQSSEDARLMADTIKLFSDTNVNSKIVLVGVAESIGDLVSEHQSIARNVAQIHVEAMPIAELSEIIEKGYTYAGLDHEDNLERRIATWSQGYPHYTHLLGLWAGRRAIESNRTTVTHQDLEQAVEDALENASGGVQQEYELAVASAHGKTLFKEVLLACALADKDSLGRFSSVAVREPLARITSHDYNTDAYQSHLAKFCEPKRGPALKKSGTKRNYRWQFVNPQLIPYVRLSGIKSGLLSG